MDITAVLQEAVQEHTPRGIAAAISQLANDGTLPPGTRLPTVRSLARVFHVSASTVNDAWHLLARNGIIRTEGRRGTFVSYLRPARLSVRSRQASANDVYRLDLTTGTPDARLLPQLQTGLGVLSQTASITTYREPLIVPRLEELLRARWDGVLDPEAVMIVDGAMDAIDRVFRDTIFVGDRVVVEDVSLPAFYDLIETCGAVPIGVPTDDEGMLPDALATALAVRPTAIVLQSRAHNPTGISMSPRRARELAEVIAERPVLVIEDDATGEISASPLASVGTWHPYTVHVRSFSKSHGPDLRLAALAGPRQLIERLEVRRRLGPGWSSRLLQHILSELLSDPVAERQVAMAREAYAARRRALSEAVEARGLRTRGADGINLWIEVAAERVAVRMLRDIGIGVSPGRPFHLEPSDRAFVRVTCAALDGSVDELADQLAWAGLETGRMHGVPRAAGLD